MFPLVKTGGLADVSQSLPRALGSMGHDVRVVMPAYGSVLEKLSNLGVRTELSLQDSHVRVLESRIPGSELHLLLVDCLSLFSRKAGPYVDEEGKPWIDNAQRFALFSRAIAAIATDKADLEWQPDILHCNDWQTGLAPALLHFEPTRPAVVFTIHNLGYQGVFSFEVFTELDLPSELWSFDSMEFFGSLSFIKGGIVYADRVNTVSPTYAKEIQTAEFGCGLDGLLKHINHKLSGITNGIDIAHWNPADDPLIAQAYSWKSITNKIENKKQLQKELMLTVDEGIPLLGVISRLVEQKGVDLIIELLAYLSHFNVQVAILGSGNKKFETLLKDIGTRYPNKFQIRIGFDEQLAHRITAGADIFLMPSAYEPCGLNQLYSQRYGTIPIVRSTGGLADTVENAGEDFSGGNDATGFVFDEHAVDELLNTVIRALDLYTSKALWKQLQANGMRRDFSWQKSAEQYLAVYILALEAYEAL